MRTFLVYRYGSNAANQPMCDKAAICFVQANTKQGALQIAATKETVYNNQSLEAVPDYRVSARDWNSACEDNLPTYCQ